MIRKKGNHMSENAVNRLKSYAEDILHNKTKLIRILLIVLILMLALVLRIHEDSKADITVESAAEGASSSEICVDIGGAVVKPGVYTVEPHTRLFEVIEMAGGLVSNADTDAINRAEYVEDGEKIVIPTKPSAGYQGEMSAGDGSLTDALSEEAVPQSYEESSAMSGGLINLNYATKEELMTLPGIGEAKAASIIEYRSSTRFRKKEDVKSVNGIGDSIYSKIKDLITV